MIGKLIFAFLITGVALLACAYFIPGFDITGGVLPFLALTGILTIIYLILRPIIRLVLSPLIIFTFGLFNIVINAAILFIVDIYSENISIDGLLPLLYATLLISVLQLILGFNRRRSADI